MKKPLSHLFYFVTLLLLLSTSSNLIAQNNTVNYNLILQKEQKIVPQNFQNFLEKDNIQPAEVISGKYYRLIQFFEIPTNEEKAAMENLGIEFLSYFPSRAYIASIPSNLQKTKLENRGIRAIIPIDISMKKDKSLIDLDLGHVSVHSNDVEVLLGFHSDINMEWAERTLRLEGVEVLLPMLESKTMNIYIPIDDIDRVGELPFVSHIAIMPAPGEPEDLRGRSLHRSNQIDSELSSGMHFNGEGVAVLVRDDGLVGPHIDFKGRDVQNVGSEDGFINHADGVAGVMGGAGNLDPDMKGMATHADMFIINYVQDFQQNLIALNLHQTEDVLVVNSSYSNGCNTGYTAITQTVDRHVYENPTFLHVFSAGNSNNQDCGYGAGNQWGNITGGHKQGKNVIATANVFENAVIANSSSRGPAHDGRIKPDITANGQNQNSTDPFNQYSPFGGTSAAAPGVAGVSAQLHHAYRDFNGGTTAPSALIKGTILNTANDLGNIGPDFIFGWGHLNSYRAVKLLEDGRYESDMISQGENNAHTITIPAGTVQARVMLYWNELASNPSTGKALINDLDMVVTSPDGSTQLPWVLDDTPNPATLNLPATNGEDHLNNVEQILFDDPAAGDYTIDISGFEVPFGPQEYFLLYEIITDEITVTYPVGGEGFEPGEQERIRWDAYGDDGQFVVEYTLDNGATWINMSTVDGEDRMLLWNPVNQITGEMRVRVSRNGFSDESDDNLSICRIPTGLDIEQFCPNFMRVSWNPVANATGYDVFYLGERHMDSIGTTNATEFDIPLPTPFGEHWFSVRARGDNGLRGKRAIAERYDGGLLNCVLNNDVATTQIFSPSVTSIVSCDPVQDLISIQVENTSINDQPVLSFGYQIDNQPVVTETFSGILEVGEVIQHTFSTPVDFTSSGVFQLKTWSTIPNDDVFFNDTIVREIVVSLGDVVTPLPEFFENFGGTAFPPDDWFTSNPDGSFGWEQVEVIGSNDNNTQAALVRNRFYDEPGQRDELFSIPLDLTNIDNPVMTFDLAYALFTNTCSDTLIIEVYTECGDVFQEEIYNKSGSDLATDGFSPTNWLPNDESDWRQELVLLSDYIGDTVLVKFINVTGNCNNLVIDNINITNFALPTAAFTANPTAVCIGEEVSFNNNSDGALATYTWTFGQGASFAISTDANPEPVFYITSGEKDVRLIVSNPLGNDTIFQVVTVLDDPDADFDVDQVGLGYQFTNTSDQATSFFWDFGDNFTSTEENPFHAYANQGTFNVKLTATNMCSEDFHFDNLDVTVTDVDELTNDVQLLIIPNPNDGNFNLKIDDVTSRALDIQIIDVQGRNMGTWNTQSVSGTTYFPIVRENYPSGIYFVKIIGEDGSRVLRMTIQ